METDVAKDRRGLRVLGLDDCLDRLRTAVVARLAFIHDGEPVVLPVTFGLDGTTVLFRTSWGSKLQAAGDNNAVAVEVDEIDQEKGRGWSVLVKGTAAIEYDTERAERWDRELDIPYWLPDGPGSVDTFWVRVTAEEISGRELVAPST
jgi:nitroimidazol reductase NimA-like FMN-containing flavoprotein (pyridoxamine 5'-phosphate oxidase superfamily)